jgi:hypothetical protein
MNIKIFLGIDSIELDVNPATTTVAELRQQAVEAFKRKGSFDQYPRRAHEACDPKLVLSLNNEKLLSEELYLTQTAYQAGNEFKFWKDLVLPIRLQQNQVRVITVNFYATLREFRASCLSGLNLPDDPDIQINWHRGGGTPTDLMGDFFYEHKSIFVTDRRSRAYAFVANLASSVKSLIWSSSSSSQTTQQITPASTVQNAAGNNIELKTLNP